MKLSPILFIIFWITILEGLSQTADKVTNYLTYQEAVAICLEKNYAIRIADKDRQIAANNFSPGNAGMLPLVDINASKTFQNQNIELEIQGRDSTFTIQRDGAKSDRLNTSIGLNWTIFDGLGMFITYDKLAELRDIGEYDAQVIIQNAVAAISDVFYRTMLEQAKLAVFKETLEISQQRVDFARNRYEVGKGSKLDFLSAQVDYNADRTALIVQIEFLHNSKVDLNVLLARPVDVDFTVEPIFELEEDMIFEELLEKIKTRNPELVRAMREQNVAYLEYREINANRYPIIDLGVNYGYGTSNTEVGSVPSSSSNGLSYSVTASWNIFDGFNRIRELQNARLDKDVQALEQEALELDLSASLKKVYHNFNTSLELIIIEKENQSVARENASIALDRYQLGAGTPLLLREAQRNAVDANIRLLDIQLAAKRAEIEILRLTGSIISE